MLKSDKNTSRKEKTDIPDYRCKISNKILTNQIQQQLKGSVQFSCSVVSNSLQPHESQHARPPCPSQSQPKPTSIESVMASNHLILCRPLLLQLSIFPRIRVFSNDSALCIRWPKYWSFSFNIVLPMNTQD